MKPAAQAADPGTEKTLAGQAPFQPHGASRDLERQPYIQEVPADERPVLPPRLPRRTRTLADIAHPSPSRLAGTRADDPGDSSSGPVMPRTDLGPISGGHIPAAKFPSRGRTLPATLGQMAGSLLRREPAAARPLAPADPRIASARPRPPETRPIPTPAAPQDAPGQMRLAPKTRPISVPAIQPGDPDLRRLAPKTRPIPNPGAQLDASGQMRAPLKTRPIATATDLRASGSLPRTPRQPVRATREKAVRESPLRRFLQAVHRGDGRLILRMALAHVLIGLLAALTASAMLLAGNDQGYWPLSLAALAIPGGVTAYALLSGKRAVVPGSLALVGAQLAALVWAYTLIGPELALLMLLPAALWLALRMGGRLPALLCGLGGLIIYLVFLTIVALGVYRPAVIFDPQAHVLLDGLGAAVGVALVIAASLRAAAAQRRGAAAARARLYELRLVRAEMASLRERTEQDGQKLEESLAEALRGRGLDPITADGSLSPVAEAVNAVAERLATLQKDREDRLRLEGALRTLIRTVERSWLGLSWSWPEPSNTMLDDLVALLRAPRPQDRRGPQAAAPAFSDDVPTFLMLPTVSASSQTPPSVPVPPPSASAANDDTPKPRPGWDDLLSR